MILAGHRRHAFTLLEVLVVVAILSILAALLFSVMVRARDNGRRTVCQSNLKQLAAAMQLYLQDNGSKFPVAATTTMTNGVASSIEWDVALLPYLSTHKVFECPSVPTPRPSDSFHLPLDYQLGRDINEWIEKNPFPTPQGHWVPQHEAQFPKSAETELFEEQSVLDEGVPITGRPIQTSCGTQFMVNLHFDGSNVAYLDGHVKWISANEAAKTTCR